MTARCYLPAHHVDRAADENDTAAARVNQFADDAIISPDDLSLTAANRDISAR